MSKDIRYFQWNLAGVDEIEAEDVPAAQLIQNILIGGGNSLAVAEQNQAQKIG